MGKKFGKLFAVLLAFTVILSACGTSGEKADTKSAESKEGKKTLRVVTNADYAPFEYMDKGKVVGFDVDLVTAVAKEAGYDVKVENVGWDPMFIEIDEKRADVGVAAITINDDRKQSYDFSSPYFLSTVKILVKQDSDIKSAADLKGKVVSVQNATTGQEAAEKILGKNYPNLKKFENNILAIMEMINGGADAVIADNTVVEEYAKNNPKQNLKVVEDETAFESEFYGFLFPKGSELKDEFDTALKEVIDNGTYAKIYKQWFKVEPDLEKLKAESEDK
jgi:ABC-type amino acid transport substrate-binding protein